MTTYLYSGGLSYAFGRPSELNLLKFFNPKKGWTVVDAGAFIGWYTLIASKRVGVEGKVVAIEPEPRNFSILLKNIRDNGLRNVIPLNLALSDKDGYELLSINPSPAGHSIVSSSSQRILVKARKIDTLLTELNIERVDLFKIDEEGDCHIHHKIPIKKGSFRGN
jgi:FkbM family methyltransferase